MWGLGKFLSTTTRFGAQEEKLRSAGKSAHGVERIEATHVLDAFSPPRDEYLAPDDKVRRERTKIAFIGAEFVECGGRLCVILCANRPTP